MNVFWNILGRSSRVGDFGGVSIIVSRMLKITVMSLLASAVWWGSGRSDCCLIPSLQAQNICLLLRQHKTCAFHLLTLYSVISLQIFDALLIFTCFQNYFIGLYFSFTIVLLMLLELFHISFSLLLYPSQCCSTSGSTGRHLELCRKTLDRV